jgi:hypothetical protein
MVIPTVAGPFDLGTVLVRVAVYVDPATAQITAVSDPFPAILRGIPLDVRSVQVSLNRAGFTLNPTSCGPETILGSTTSDPEPRPQLTSSFQMGECGRLGFDPGIAVRLMGPAHRGAHPKLRTVLTPRHGDANLRRVAITLPETELLDSRHIGAVCTRPQFANHRCPADSAYGYARAWTPLLDRPLEGPVYLRASGTRLPDLAATLSGQIDLDLVGRIVSVHGRLRNTFRALPDAPLSRVVVTMKGGDRGLLVNTGGLCDAKPYVDIALAAHNGKVRNAALVVGTACGKQEGR